MLHQPQLNCELLAQLGSLCLVRPALFTAAVKEQVTAGSSLCSFQDWFLWGHPKESRNAHSLIHEWNLVIHGRVSSVIHTHTLMLSLYH